MNLNTDSSDIGWISDTDRIFNGYRTNTYINTDIFRILSKNIIYIIKKYLHVIFFDRIINYKN
jgi:hypothetical protein